MEQRTERAFAQQQQQHLQVTWKSYPVLSYSALVVGNNELLFVIRADICTL